MRIETEKIVHNPCVTSPCKERMGVFRAQREGEAALTSWIKSIFIFPKGTAKKHTYLFSISELELHKYFNSPSAYCLMFAYQEDVSEHRLA